MHRLRGNGEREVAAAVGAPAPAEGDLVGRFASITAAELGDERARALGDRVEPIVVTRIFEQRA